MLLSGLICVWCAPVLALSHSGQTGTIPTRDGRSLACDFYLPTATQGPWPVILVQTPYNKDLFDPIFQYDYREPLLHNPNFAFVFVDWRGFFGSTAAAYEGSPTYGQDGYDAVEWAAGQTWCTGRVGTWGASACGMVQLQTATEQPPHLRACVPVTYYFRQMYDLFYPGGVFASKRNSLIFGMFGGYPVWEHPLYDTWWDYCENSMTDYSRIDVPMLHISGWYDHETARTIAEMQNIQTSGGPGAVGQQKVLIGPWTHGTVGKLQQGQLQYPAAELDSSEAAAEFFDYHLRDVQNGYPLRPAVRYYRMNEDVWIGATDWPVASTPKPLYLQANGTLTGDASGEAAAWIEYLANPTTPVPTLFGAVVFEGAAARGPGDLGPIEVRADVLEFTTPPMTSPLTIEGEAQARVWISCQTPGAIDTDVAVRLTQVYPDGRSMLLVDSIQRASLRTSYTGPSYLTTGNAVEIVVSLPPVSVTIPLGHSLRVLVAPSNYDRFEINPQDGSPFPDMQGTVLTPANIRLWMDRDHPSRVVLPLPAPRAPGDFDGDGDVDETDRSHLLRDADGPAARGLGHKDSDLDGDGDVDQIDFGILQRCFSGAEIPAAMDCDQLSH